MKKMMMVLIEQDCPYSSIRNMLESLRHGEDSLYRTGGVKVSMLGGNTHCLASLL